MLIGSAVRVYVYKTDIRVKTKIENLHVLSFWLPNNLSKGYRKSTFDLPDIHICVNLSVSVPDDQLKKLKQK